MEAKPGSLISIETGEYSDYQVLGFFVVLNEFEPMVELENYIREKELNKGNFRVETFLAYLISKGFLLEVKYDNFFIDMWGDLDDSHFRTFEMNE